MSGITNIRPVKKFVRDKTLQLILPYHLTMQNKCLFYAKLKTEDNQGWVLWLHRPDSGPPPQDHPGLWPDCCPQWWKTQGSWTSWCHCYKTFFFITDGWQIDLEWIFQASLTLDERLDISSCGMNHKIIMIINDASRLIMSGPTICRITYHIIIEVTS